MRKIKLQLVSLHNASCPDYLSPVVHHVFGWNIPAADKVYLYFQSQDEITAALYELYCKGNPQFESYLEHDLARVLSFLSAPLSEELSQSLKAFVLDGSSVEEQMIGEIDLDRHLQECRSNTTVGYKFTIS